MQMSKARHFLAVVLALSLVAAACGDDDGGVAEEPDTAVAEESQPDQTSTDDAGADDDHADHDHEDDDHADDDHADHEEDDHADDDHADDHEDDDHADDHADDEAPVEPSPAPGFDGTTINVGIISDFSGPVALAGIPLAAGFQVYVDYVNSQGGVAGRYPIETIQADSTYNPTTGVQVYNEIKDDVAVIGHIAGTAVVNAILESLKADDLIASPASVDAFWVREPNLLPWGSPYQIEAINGLDWWINEGGGSADQVFCTFIQDDPYGAAGQAGAEFAAEKLGFEIAETARYVVGDADYSSQVQQLQSAGCEVVFLVAVPNVTGAALGISAQSGFAPQWIGTLATWINALLAAEPLVPYLESQLVIIGEGATWGDDGVPGMAEMIAHLEEFNPEQAPDYYFIFGYIQALATVALLEQAVANGDLSREGMKAALEDLGTVSFGGLTGDFTYGPAADRQPPTESTIFRVNTAVPNGIEAIVVNYESEFAGDFVIE